MFLKRLLTGILFISKFTPFHFFLQDYIFVGQIFSYCIHILDITTTEEKRKVAMLKWNHRQPKNNKQVCCPRECTCPFDPTTVILQHIPTEWAFYPKLPGISVSSVFVSYTVTHNNEDVYHHKSNSWGSRSAWKKGTGEPQDNRLVRNVAPLPSQVGKQPLHLHKFPREREFEGTFCVDCPSRAIYTL